MDGELVGRTDKPIGRWVVGLVGYILRLLVQLLPFALQDVALHHLIRQDGKPHAEEISVFEKYFDKCRQEPDKYSVSNKRLKKYRKLLFVASVEELKHYEVVLATCAVGGNRKLVEGTLKTVFQVDNAFVSRYCTFCAKELLLQRNACLILHWPRAPDACGQDGNKLGQKYALDKRFMCNERQSSGSPSVTITWHASNY